MADGSAQEYQDNPGTRRELVAFLERPGGLCPQGCDWAARLAHWWEENPFATDDTRRGLTVRRRGRLAAFGGCIPGAYALHGERVPVLMASTLDVAGSDAPACRAIMLRLRSEARHTPLVITTPVPKLWPVLERMGARAQTRVICHYHPGGALARWLGRRAPALDSGVRVVTDMEGVTAVARAWQRAERLEKWRCVEGLRWQLGTPTRRQHLLGAVDAAGVLSSFLVLSPCRLHGVPALEVVDFFTTREDASELHALAGLIPEARALGLPGALLWTVRGFPGDSTWDAPPALARRAHRVCHYFLLPPGLRDAPKHSVMAEGDLVL